MCKVIKKSSGSYHNLSIFFLHKKCPYSELFWSAFSRIRTRITPNTDTFHAVLNLNWLFLLQQSHSYTSSTAAVKAPSHKFEGGLHLQLFRIYAKNLRFKSILWLYFVGRLFIACMDKILLSIF